MELCPSPDKTMVLFHDGQRRGADILHCLMLLEEARDLPEVMYTTRTMFEVSWASNSRRFAITDFIGHNRSQVSAFEMDDRRRIDLDVSRFIEEFFPQRFWDKPMFVRVYRWTTDGAVIIRAIGMTEGDSNEQFGCEVSVRFKGFGGEFQTEYLSGYVWSR
jgi:hypothetical protein